MFPVKINIWLQFSIKFEWLNRVHWIKQILQWYQDVQQSLPGVQVGSWWIPLGGTIVEKVTTLSAYLATIYNTFPQKKSEV